ncbi:MAG: hypothetical protein V4594_12125 [Bacteroidota bacterium]
MRHCKYQQLAENVKIITRELFKKLNLEGLSRMMLWSTVIDGEQF